MTERDFDTIYTDYSRLVYWAAYKVLLNRAAAEDVAQSVFEKVIRNMDTIAKLNDAQLKGWLYRVSNNLALDVIRKSSREQLSDEPIGIETADTDPLPEDAALDKQRLLSVRQAINELDDIYRDVIMLYYFSEMTVREISENTGISEGTVKSRLVRARNLLAEKLLAEVT